MSKLASLFEIAEHNAFKKNYAKPLLKTNKDVVAFLSFANSSIWHNFYFDKDVYIKDEINSVTKTITNNRIYVNSNLY